MTTEEKTLLMKFFLFHGSRLYQELEDADANYFAHPTGLRLLQKNSAEVRLQEFELLKRAIMELLHLDSDNTD